MRPIALTVGVVFLLLAGCGERLDLAKATLTVRQIRFSTDIDARGFPINPQQEFSGSDRKIYTMVELQGVTAEVGVTGVWTYLQKGEEVARMTIQAAPLREFVRFDLQSPNPLPAGLYRFSVEAEQRGETATGSAMFMVKE